MGRIEVLYEVPVNSLWGGIMTRLEVKLGQRVAAGDPLAEVRSVLTQQGVLAAEEQLELLRKGEAASADRQLDYVIRAPVA